MHRRLSLSCGALALLLAGRLGAQQCGTPVGTVVAYMGNAVPANWMVADGRPLRGADFTALYQAIGTAHGAGYQGSDKVADFNLPDLRGQFLRGVDRSESGAASGRDSAEARRPAAPGGSSGMAVGTVQEATTRMPRNVFATAGAGAHSHSYTSTPIIAGQGNQGTFWHLAGNPSGAGTSTDGEHAHPVTGGDRETRPTNVAVYWIICVR